MPSVKQRLAQFASGQLRRVYWALPASIRRQLRVWHEAYDEPVSGRVDSGILATPASGQVASSAGVFVFGCPRSGTSVLSWALAAHPDFWTSDESDFLHYLYGQNRLRQAYRTACVQEDRGFLPVNQVTYAEYAAAIGLGIDQLFLSRSGGRRWVNSDPGYVLMADDLAFMFPRAKFINLVRDGRAVVSSMLHSGFEWPWAKEMRAACETWVHYVRAGHEFARQQPERCLQANLESLKEAVQFRAILEFLAAPLSDGPWQYMQANRINSSYGNVSPSDIRKPKDPHSLPREPWRQWKTEDKKTFSEVCGAMMLDLGYPLDLN